MIEHCGIRFREPPSAGRLDEQWVYVGDDVSGAPLEVITVDLETGELLVIHAMPLRERYQTRYEEAKRWRRP